jgi:predicted aspartyl protease
MENKLQQMNWKFFSLLFLFFLFGLFPRLNAADFPTNKNLKVLIDSGEYFQFKEDFQKQLHASPHGKKVSNDDFYYYSWYYFLFNKSPESNLAIETLLAKKEINLSDSIVAELLELHFQNDFRLFDYKKADSICTILLFRYSSAMEKETLDGIRNTGAITAALKNTPAQTVERKEALDISFKRDMASLIRIPVNINDQNGNFILDTGANLSTLSESEAKKMGVKILDVNFAVASSSRSSVPSKLGVANILKIGNVTFRNVVFIILPDKSLSFIGGAYKIKGIIGLPVIAQLGEIQIHKNKHLISPIQQTESDLQNLGLNGNTPFANVNYFGSYHPYIFDTGAATGILGNKFYYTYQDSLKKNKKGTSHIGGAGGSEKISIIKIKQLHYEFANQKGHLKNASIQVSGSSKAVANYYGIVGEDIFMQWNTMTINFDQMFVLLK